MTTRTLPVLLLLLMVPAVAAGQGFNALGTRAAGMAGAFVGVADDASAIYWNPAGLASGSYFSLVLDFGSADASPDVFPAASERSSFLIGLTTPALGIGYYRLHTQSARRVVPLLLPGDGGDLPDSPPVVSDVRLDSLITHHGGVTLVQSLTQGVAIGANLKLVRGIAASQLVPLVNPSEALEGDAAELLGRATNRFDADFGVMVYGGPLRVGLTLRNLWEPSFPAAGIEGELILDRQARIGTSYAITPDWMAAADADLTRTTDAFGERRDFAVGVEGRLAKRAYVRSGFRFNTLEGEGDEDPRRPAYSFGGSYAVKAAIYLDGHYTTGGDRTGREWGIAARFVY